MRRTPRIKHDSLVGSNEECDHARLAAVGDIFWLSRIGPSLYPNTLSPTWKDVTPLPTASIRPANSVPRTVDRGLTTPGRGLMKKGLVARQEESVRFTVVAWILTSTALSTVVGRSPS